MKTIIYVPDIECDNCKRLISKGLDRDPSVKGYTVTDGTVEVTLEEGAKPHHIIKLIQDRGFRAGTVPFARKTFKERMRDFRENKGTYEIERTGIQYTALAFVILLVIEAIAYASFFRAIPGFLANYAIWLLYLDISIALIGLSLWHLNAYKGQVTCMTGMMIGMTAGMQTGMMIGAIVGAVNGFFAGAMVGMLLGTAVGAMTGRTCGVMGTMQGMMAGLMGGTMGPMISLMMINDHLFVFMPVYMALNAIIILAMPYMVYEEVVEDKKVERRPADMVTFISLCIIAAAILVAIMVLGPKSILFSIG